MAQDLDLFLNIGHLVGIGHAALNTDELKPGYRPGALSIVFDAFGERIFKYGQTQQSGGMAKGELTSRLADVTGTVTATAPEVNDTTHLADTGAFTADREAGKLCMITDNNDSAGAAPEGEVAVIVGNTADQLTMDPGYPFSVAPAISDTFANRSVYHHDDAADGDFAINVMGIVMADRTALSYGWNQVSGFNPGALYDTGAVTKGNPVVATTAAVNAHGSDTSELWVGYCPNTVAADLVTPFRAPVVIEVWNSHHSIAHA